MGMNVCCVRMLYVCVMKDTYRYVWVYSMCVLKLSCVSVYDDKSVQLSDYTCIYARREGTPVLTYAPKYEIVCACFCFPVPKHKCTWLKNFLCLCACIYI